MLLIINKYLNDITKTDDGNYVGYIDSAAKYNQFMTALKDAGFYFSIRDSERFREDGQFLFKCNKSIVPVPFSGYPFRRERNITYQCAFGSQYYGKVKKKESSETMLSTCEKKRGRVRHSKKLGCKAKMAAKCIRIYLDYKIPSETSHWRLKKEVISLLKQDLSSKECEVKSLSRYFIKISSADQHCHMPMHPRSSIRNLLDVTKCKKHELDGDEDKVFVATDQTEGDTTYDTVCVVGDEGKLVDLRELCRQKGKEVATLSQHLCHDEDQLRELLTALTRVTNRLHESQLEAVRRGEEEGSSVSTPLVEVIVENSLPFQNHIPQSVVVKDESTDLVEESIEDCGVETERVYLSSDPVNVNEDNEEREGQIFNANVQLHRVQERNLIPLGATQQVQKKLNISGAQVSSEHDLQSGDFDEGNVIYYFIG